MTQEAKVINIDGKDYKEDELSDNQKYLINQINDCQAQANQLRFKHEQVLKAQNAFTQELIETLEKKENN